MAADRRSYDDPCGIARALDVIGERWAVLILRELMFGPRRFGQLLDGLPGISPNVLSQRLRELEGNGVLRRYTLEPPAAVAVYELTQRGTALEPVLLELGRWGSRTARVGGRELSPAAMLMALRTMFDPASTGSAVYGVQLAGEWYTFTIADGRLRIVRNRPDDPVAALTTDVATLRLVTFLGTGVKAAEQAGKLTIEGDRRAANRFPRYFRRPEPAPSG